MTHHDTSQGSTIAGRLVRGGSSAVGTALSATIRTVAALRPAVQATAPRRRRGDGHPREAGFHRAVRGGLGGRAGSRRGRRTPLAGDRPPRGAAGHPRARHARPHAGRRRGPVVRLDGLGPARALRAHLRQWAGVSAVDDPVALSHRRGPGAARRPRDRPAGLRDVVVPASGEVAVLRRALALRRRGAGPVDLLRPGAQPAARPHAVRLGAAAPRTVVQDRQEVAPAADRRGQPSSSLDPSLDFSSGSRRLLRWCCTISVN